MKRLVALVVYELLSLIPEQQAQSKIGPNTKLASYPLIINIVKNFGKNCNLIPHPKSQKLTFAEKQRKILQHQPPSKPENLKERPPVVTVMGHVDHGKTTLLDSLRNTFVVAEEFGGITQHIGAFSVEVKPGKRITFIDTPGHAAFTSMRARGAQVTDLVVLVIAADDGIMEQTIESIRITKRASVPLVIAVNKIDKPNALKLDDIKEKLLHEGLQVEDLGGQIQLVPISALKKINLDLLTEVILLEAEAMNLRGDPTGLVEGVIIESKIDEKGRLATMIVKRGTLKKGKILVAGKAFARVKLMLDEKGKEYKEALPSTPVQILGWKELPAAGDEVIETVSQKNAEQLIKLREQEELSQKELNDLNTIRQKLIARQEEVRKEREKVANMSAEEKKAYYVENLKKQFSVKETNQQERPCLNLILKGDVHGSLEVLQDVLATYDKDDECSVSIVAASVGNISKTDVELAEMFNGIIFGFNVNYHDSVKELALSKKVDVRFHNILYKLIDDLKAELTLRIPPVDVEEIIGEAEVLQNFVIQLRKKKVNVAGSKCTSGILKREALYRIKRKDEVIFEGNLDSMKHFKNEVDTIQKNSECGLMFNSFNGSFEPGDQIICYELVKKNRTTSWDPGF